MLTIITVAAVMMGLAVTLIHRLLEAEHDAQNSARTAAAASRLAEHWRSDLHAARSVELAPPEPGQPALLVATTGAGRKIRYELDRHVATRREDLGDNQEHHDNFYFPPRTRLEFARADESGLVRLQIEIPTGDTRASRKYRPAEEPFRRLIIEAAPSRDRRFERREP